MTSGPWEKLRRAFTLRSLYSVVMFANSEGASWTPRRLLNFRRAQREYARGRTHLRSYPIKLTIEATNVCNLRCPACFTGSGEAGRRRGAIPQELLSALMSELGPYLLEVEFHNWGEPLLNKHLEDMVAEAARYGVTTSFSTNFSFPFTTERAERLVRSGLTVLGVSIDGAQQSSYEQYRVGGDLALVLRNCALMQEAKRRLGSRTPRLVWSYHVFPHNRDEVAAAEQMARQLDMDFSASKGWMVGPDWDPAMPFFVKLEPARCGALWYQAVVHNDGGVAPCCVTFYRQDDLGSIGLTAAEVRANGFGKVWNSPRFQSARRLFTDQRAPRGSERTVCDGCPVTIVWQDWRKHRDAGQTRETFTPRFNQNDLVNAFWDHRPARVATAPGAARER